MRDKIIAAVLMAALGVAGCGQVARHEADDAAVDRRDCIDTRCVVSYQQGPSPYWTDQRQRFCPSSVFFEAWGTEPEGAYRATLSRGQFSASGLDGAMMQALPGGLMRAPLAEAVYYGFTAGAGFVPTGMAPLEPVRIEGQRYEAFGVNGGSGRVVTLYKNAVTGQIELVRVADGGGLDWMARSYNPRYNERFGRMIPRKMDVFDIRQGIASKKLLVQFDYVDVR